MTAYAIFFSLSFLRHPSRLYAVVADVFRPNSEGKLGKYVRSMVRTSRQLKAGDRAAAEQGPGGRDRVGRSGRPDRSDAVEEARSLVAAPRR